MYEPTPEGSYIGRIEKSVGANRPQRGRMLVELERTDPGGVEYDL